MMKYFAKKVKYLGHTFDSKTETERYAELLNLQKQRFIEQLQMQKEFELLPKQIVKVVQHLKTKDKIVERVDERAVLYHADFFYYDRRTMQWVIEEVKSPMTAKVRDYPLRRKLVKLMVKRMNAEQGRELYAFVETVVGRKNVKKRKKATK